MCLQCSLKNEYSLSLIVFDLIKIIGYSSIAAFLGCCIFLNSRCLNSDGTLRLPFNYLVFETPPATPNLPAAACRY